MELDQYPRAVEADAGHSPDAGTRNLDDAVGLQTARLSEVRRVLLFAGEESQLVVIERNEYGRSHYGETDPPDEVWVAFGELLRFEEASVEASHFGVHLPDRWLASVT